MTDSCVDVSPLLGGVSFLSLKQLDTEVREATPSIVPKRTPAQRAVEALLGAIERADAPGVKEAIAHCKPEGLLPKRVARTLIEHGFDPDVAQVLFEYKFLDPQHLVDIMGQTPDWKGMGWLLATPERIEWMERWMGMDVSPDQTSAASERRHITGLITRSLEHPTGWAELGQINLPYVLRNMSKQNAWYIVGHTQWLGRLMTVDPSIEQIQALDLLFDPQLVRSAFPSSEQTVRWRTAAQAERLISWVAHQPSPDKFIALEKILQHGPRVRAAWQDYWNIPQDDDTLPSITSLSVFRGMLNSFQTRRCNVRVERFDNLLDVLLFQCKDWLVETMVHTGPVPDALWNRVKEGPNQLFCMVAGLDYAQMNILIPHIIDRLGVHWRDRHGLGLGETMLLAFHKPGRSIIQRLLRDPRGREVLTVPNAHGKSAMDVLVPHEHWKTERPYLAQLARKLLMEQSGKGGSGSKGRRTPERRAM